MKGKRTIIILAVCNILIVALIIYLYISSDTDKPVLSYQDNGLIYTQLTTQEEMLAGVSAQDERDGDVTDTLIIEKITTDDQKRMAIIVYGARDIKGNIGKLSRTVPYEASVESSEDVRESYEEETPEAIAESTETTEEETTSTEETAESKSESEPENGEEKPAEDPKPADDSSKKPVLSFKSDEVKTKKGLTPAWVNVIEHLSDDTDNYEQLLSKIVITGDYDVNKTGSYPVQVSVKDFQGNESDKKKITIIVEE